MWTSRKIVQRSVGMGQGTTRFPWARTMPRERRVTEPERYRCTRCAMRFKSSVVPRSCPECGGPVNQWRRGAERAK